MLHVMLLLALLGHSSSADTCSAGASCTDANDEVSLLQNLGELKRGAQAKELSTDTCSCLTWSTLYRENVVRCGDGEELSGPEIATWGDDGLCSSNTPLYTGLNHNLCVKRSKLKSEMPQPVPNWCYVSASCGALNGGRAVNSRVSSKMCGDGDRALADLSPRELFEMGAGQDAQMLAIMAYPWQGPPDYHPGQPAGTLLNVGLQSPERAVIGPSLKEDTFTVLWRNQVWEIRDEAVCVDGC
mmetsp:Transcript_53826/g.129676  ORF Transcript_53826/g.129676 Transcript_53826/m.129676 type:complete len:242 (+) Transcript_53826:96-821(+)